MDEPDSARPAWAEEGTRVEGETITGRNEGRAGGRMKERRNISGRKEGMLQSQGRLPGEKERKVREWKRTRMKKENQGLKGSEVRKNEQKARFVLPLGGGTS